ncbi:MAG: adenylosuccinate lyase, partial [Candidatus Bathyarchaeia archaeon]
ILLDYMLVLMNRVLSGLRVNEERMRVNLNLTRGLFMSESVMLVLTRKGMPRQHAHEKVRELSLKSAAEDKELMDLLLEDPDVRKTLTVEEIAAALKPENYLGTTQTQVQRAVEAAENTLRTLDVG